MNIIEIIKDKLDYMPKYVRYALLGIISTLIAGGLYYFVLYDTKGLDIIVSRKNNVNTNVNANNNIQEINNTSQIQGTGNLKNINNIKNSTGVNKIKDVAVASNDENIKGALGIKNDTNKVITGSKIDLKNIKDNEFLDIKKNVKNINTLPKDFLKKFKAKQIKRYKELITDNIVKQLGIKKTMLEDIKKSCTFYPYYCKKYTVLSVDNIIKLMSNINNLKVERNKKCVKVFGKEECKIETKKFFKYKDIYLDYNMLYYVSTHFQKGNYIIFLARKLNNKYISDKYLSFNNKYGWYGYKGIKLYKKAIENNNYEIMYLYDHYNISNIKELYNKNILYKINNILGINLDI